MTFCCNSVAEHKTWLFPFHLVEDQIPKEIGFPTNLTNWIRNCVLPDMPCIVSRYQDYEFPFIRFREVRFNASSFFQKLTEFHFFKVSMKMYMFTYFLIEKFNFECQVFITLYTNSHMTVMLWPRNYYFGGAKIYSAQL